MLSREALEAALPLAQRLDAAGVKLSAIQQTPLGELVKATHSTSQFAIRLDNSNDFSVSIPDIVDCANSRDGDMGLCPHDVCLDNVAEVGIKAVQTALNIARNMVAPAVDELYRATAEQLSALPPSQLLGMEVKVFDLPTPYKLPQLDGMVRKFEAEIPDVLPLNFRMPSMTVPEIAELMHVGAAGFNEAIDAWIAEKGETFVLQMWEDLFQIKSDRFKSVAEALINKELGPHYAIGGFLIARKLAEEPIEGIEMPLPEFEKAIVLLRNQCAAKVCRVLDEWETQAKRGILVRSSGDSWIEVYENVYRPWIEQGGDNETLFGNLLSRPVKNSVQAITDAQTELKLAWRRHEQISQVTLRNQRYNTTKAILAREFRRQLDAVQEDLDGPDVNAGNRAHVISLFNEELGKLNDRELDQLYTVCLKLVARSRFYKTDSEEILSKIEAIKNEQPLLDIREAALIVTVEYVAEWVSSLIRVENI